MMNGPLPMVDVLNTMEFVEYRHINFFAPTILATTKVDLATRLSVSFRNFDETKKTET